MNIFNYIYIFFFLMNGKFHSNLQIRSCSTLALNYAHIFTYFPNTSNQLIKKPFLSPWLHESTAKLTRGKEEKKQHSRDPGFVYLNVSWMCLCSFSLVPTAPCPYGLYLSVLSGEAALCTRWQNYYPSDMNNNCITPDTKYSTCTGVYTMMTMMVVSNLDVILGVSLTIQTSLSVW